MQTTKETAFLYETKCSANLTEVIEEIVSIHNAILRIRCLIGYIKDLIKNGPMGEDNERRNPPENNVIVLDRAIQDAESAISADNVAKKVYFTPKYVCDELARLSGALSIVYPEGLPPTEPTRKVLEGGDVQGEFNSSTCQLWWARKSLQRGKLVSDYLGKNERVTAVGKLTDEKSGPPPRDMTMSQQEQVRLMSELHRKAEELKRIEKDDDDSYLDSEWANPNGLKNTFQGIDNIDWKPH